VFKLYIISSLSFNILFSIWCSSMFYKIKNTSCFTILSESFNRPHTNSILFYHCECNAIQHYINIHKHVEIYANHQVNQNLLWILDQSLYIDFNVVNRNNNLKEKKKLKTLKYFWYLISIKYFNVLYVFECFYSLSIWCFLFYFHHQLHTQKQHSNSNQLQRIS
jgi:hypothetical protein